MRFRWLACALCALLTLAMVMWPTSGATDDPETLMLAQTLYTQARAASDEALYAVGSVIMNRVGNPDFSETLGGVLDQRHAFARGTRIDERCVAAARALVQGKRTLSADALYFARGATPGGESYLRQIGEYFFYSDDPSALD